MVGSAGCSLRAVATSQALALAVLFFSQPTLAASAICKPNWQWSYNSEGQTPCGIAASLEKPCFGQPGFELETLQPGDYYPSPLQGTPLRKKCDCNTIIFNLYMTCTLCQGSNNTRTWVYWSQYCGVAYVTQYPFSIPQNTSIPRWAYNNYTQDGNFDPTLAQSVGRDPEAVPSSTSPFPTGTNLSNDKDGQEGGSKDSVGAIAGGIVGGAAALLVLATLSFFWYRKRPRNHRAHIIDLDPVAESQWETRAMKDSLTPPRLYDPSDPSTFPPPVLFDGETNEPSRLYTAPAHVGKYFGTPEV